MICLCPQYCVRRKPHLSKRHCCSVNVPCTRNCHSGFVKIQQQIHKEIRCIIIVRKKMWHIKNAVVFYYEAKIIIEMREKLLTRGGVYILRNFQKGHKWAKKWPPIIFFLECIHQWTSFYHFRKKITNSSLTNFFSIVQWSAREKTYNLLSIRDFTLLILANIYESPVSITSSLKTFTDPLKEIKIVKLDQKMVPSHIFFLLFPLLGTIAQLLRKKKYPTSQSL